MSVTISSLYPSSGPKLTRTFDNIASGTEAVLDVWEEDHSWAVGSGYADGDVPDFDRDAAREAAAAEAARLLAKD